MIGIVLTGHSDFALGMKNAAEMIAGEQAAFRAVPFVLGESTDIFSEKLKKGISELKQESESIIVLADLVGGTPYKTAVTLLLEDKSVKVIGGVNLALVLELSMMRFAAGNLDELVKQLLATGKEALGTFEAVEVVQKDSDEDGI